MRFTGILAILPFLLVISGILIVFDPFYFGTITNLFIGAVISETGLLIAFLIENDDHLENL